MSELVDVLVQNRRLETDEAFIAYENALNALVAAPKNPANLSRLISAFCDVEDHEGMWTLLHYVESFGMTDYVPALISVTPLLMADARRWLDSLYGRLVNSETHRAYLRTLFAHATPEQQDAVRHILLARPDRARDEALRQTLIDRVAFVLSPMND